MNDDETFDPDERESFSRRSFIQYSAAMTAASTAIVLKTDAMAQQKVQLNTEGEGFPYPYLN